MAEAQGKGHLPALYTLEALRTIVVVRQTRDVRVGAGNYVGQTISRALGRRRAAQIFAGCRLDARCAFGTRGCAVRIAALNDALSRRLSSLITCLRASRR